MSLDKCQVCSKQSHGIHFGAITCRACAAYFRRAILKKYADLECINGKEKCKNLLDLCKKCRLEKCLAAGMTETRLQLGRDPMSSTVKNIPPSIQCFVGRPSFILSCDSAASTSRSNIDFTKLIENASTILSSTSKCYVGMNTLNQLTNALSTSSPMRTSTKLCQKIGKNDILAIWEMNFLKVTRWFTHCNRFQELPLNMRIEFLKIVWLAWGQLYKDMMTAKRQIELADEKSNEGFLSDGYVYNAKKIEVDTSWFSKGNFLGPIEELCSSRLIRILMKFQPTPQETAYMLSVFCFRYAAKSFGGELEELSEDMIQVLGNELHSYYIDELKLLQYAPRIAQMMKIVNILERNIYERMEKFELARMFDVIIVDFSHPELVYGRKRG